jgi:ferrous iron transport protein B
LQKVPSLYESLSTSSPFLWLTVDGIWQGFAGAIGIVLPYFLPLLILTSLFEDTGYMARIAFLLDGLFHKIGLHGKSVAPFILGIGCTVPAIYATRIIDNRRDRLITGILLNFIPCSARLTVIFALSAAFTGPFWTAGILLFVIIVIGINGKILSHFMSKPTGLVMEVPTLKLPGLHTTYKKTYYQVREFIRTALPLLIVGSIVLGWLEYFSLSNIINSITAPLVDNILGLPEQLGSTLLFGFLRKELIIVMSTQVMGVHSVADMGLSVNQAITFTIFLILYIPCIATFGVLWKEFGKKAVLMTAVFTLSMAVISAVFVRYMLLLLGVL